MALPSGWYTDATAAISAARTCAELQDAIDKVFDSVNTVQSQIQSQLGLLPPLIVGPLGLPAIETYLAALAVYFAGPYNALLTQESEIASAIASLTTAVNNKISELACSGVSIP